MKSPKKQNCESSIHFALKRCLHDDMKLVEDECDTIIQEILATL